MPKFCFTIVLVLFMMACSRTVAPPEPAPVEPGVSLALAEERAQRVSDVSYLVHLAVPEVSSEAIAGRMEIRFHLAAVGQPLALDFRAASEALHSLQVNGAALPAAVEAEHVLLPADALHVGENRVKLRFTAGDSALNRNPEYLYTLFVPDRARTALPLFDQPDLKASWELSLDLPAAWEAIANTPRQSVSEVGERRVHRFAASEPISSYLFGFVAGEFQSVTREWRGQGMTVLHRETDPEKLARNLETIFRQHREAVAWLEDYTGVPFPFEKLDFALIPAFQYGGMEHVGAIQYRAELLLLDENPTDDERLRRASLIAHEVAHMWFGNLVTMRWFNDVWTKEVFANFMAAKMVNPLFPEVDHELGFLLRHYPAAYAVDRSAGANPIRQALGNLNEAGQMYGPIIYNKAPIMMRQLESLLGAEALREGLAEYLERFAYANATWPALVEILDRRTALDLAAWSDTWVHSAGFPPASRQAEDAALFYGPQAAQLEDMARWAQLPDVARGRLLLNLFEAMLQGGAVAPEAYARELLLRVAAEPNQLLLSQMLDQLAVLQQTLLTGGARARIQPDLEATLWQALAQSTDAGRTRLLFDSLTQLARQPETLRRLHAIWRGEELVSGLVLAERDRIRLAERLAVALPERASALIAQQLAQVENPDNQRRLAFLAPALSADAAERDAFFASLADPANRATESWVLDALGYLHHPLRIAHAERYIEPSLEWLQDIQVTGDIFFPSAWLQTTLQYHHTPEAIATVQGFLQARPEYNAQLRMKILQALDLPQRAMQLRE
jgi:aminopeptidase N